MRAVVALTFFGTRWLGARLGLSPGLSTLVAVGFSICGVSAIAAAKDVVEADEDEVTFAIALVTLCGTLAIVVLPSLRETLGLDEDAFGGWVGASVHDVGQVVATASVAGSTALATAVVVKLTRVLLLAPMIAFLALGSRRNVPGGPRRSPVPLFVVLFLAAIGLASLGLPGPGVVAQIDDLRSLLLGAALFAVGTRVTIARLVRIGPRPLVLGLLSWILIATISYAAVTIVGV